MSKTLQKTVNLASIHLELAPLMGVGGYTDEPALSLCNQVIQKLLAPPRSPLPGHPPLVLDWKFNRAEMNMFVTSPNRQDYLFAGATFFCLGGFSAGIDLTSNSALTISGTTVTIKTLEQYNGQVGDVGYILGTNSSYDSTFTQNGVTSTFAGNTYTVTAISGLTVTATLTGTASGTSGAAGITDFGWLPEATMVSLNTNTAVLPTRHLKAVRYEQPSSIVGIPASVCVVTDLGTGVLKIRLLPVPGAGQQWGVNLVYQKKAPTKTALAQTWSPFPDELSYVYEQGLIARGYRYLNSPRADIEEAKFLNEIMTALGGDSRETSDVCLVPANGLQTTEQDWWPFA